jgi:hypothetical protein
MCELVLDAWRMCVPKKLAGEYETNGGGMAPTITRRSG